MPDSDSRETQALYSGPDLENAYDRSPLARVKDRVSHSNPNPAVAYTWAARSAFRHGRNRLDSLAGRGCVECCGIGFSSNGDGAIRFRYVGESKNKAFLFTSCFRDVEILSQREVGPFFAAKEARRRDRDEDVLFIDSESPLLATRLPGLRLPPWIRQRVSLVGQWNEFITRLPRNTRREVARCIRKYQYQARIADADADFSNFYSQLYRPHVRQTFGSQAFVLEEDDFHRERAGARLIELVHNGEVVAAIVVRIAGDSMWMLWSGSSIRLEALGLKKAIDVLYYFAFLFGACNGVTKVDLGRARPRLNDGPLLFKAKWGSSIGLGYLNKPPIRLIPRNFGPAVAGMLAQNHWIVRSGNRLDGVVLLGKDQVSSAQLQCIAARYRHTGIDRIRVCATEGFASHVRMSEWIHEGIDLVDLRRASDPLLRYLSGGMR